MAALADLLSSLKTEAAEIVDLTSEADDDADFLVEVDHVTA